MGSNPNRPAVAAIYCPLWHNYDHATSWKGEGWCEWELLKRAAPRFEGHWQPYRPTWGCFDESDPAWSRKEIALAADHGIDVFIVDWYWYSGVKIMEEALERGLLKTPNREDVQFAIMWANHDWADYFPAPFGKPWNSWLPARHSPRDWERVMAYCTEHYFQQPNYWQTEDQLFFSIFQPHHLVRELGGAKAFKKVLSETNLKLSRAKLPPLHLNAMLGPPVGVDELLEAGFSSIANYNVNTVGHAPEGLTVPYEHLMGMHREQWELMAAEPLPYVPVVTMGWDVTPRCEEDVPWPFARSPLTREQDYPYGSVVVGNTPELFEELCSQGLQFCQERRPAPYAVLVNAWNEWTEGCFLLPEERHGTAYLEAIRSVFGRRD